MLWFLLSPSFPSVAFALSSSLLANCVNNSTGTKLHDVSEQAWRLSRHETSRNYVILQRNYMKIYATVSTLIPQLRRNGDCCGTR